MAQSRYSGYDRYEEPAPRRSYRNVEPRNEYRSERTVSYNDIPSSWYDKGNSLWIHSTSNPVLYVVEDAYGKQREFGLRTWNQVLRTMPSSIIVLDARPAYHGMSEGLVWKVKAFNEASGRTLEYKVLPNGTWN